MWDGDVWVAMRAARLGADEVRSGFDTEFRTSMKGQVDPVTQIDLAAEQAIRSAIVSHFPNDSILGEEEGGEAWDHGRVWIIDPLDGTVNFVHGVPQFSVSVALWSDGEPLVGVVIDVPRDEEFVAVRGEGTRLNDEPVTVSSTSSFDQALLVTGFPYDRREHARSYLDVVATVLESAQGIRRLGSAALDMAWVACGRFDGYWEYGIQPWDAAAAVLLVTEAGGTVSDHLGKENRLDAPAFIATNGEIHPDLLTIVADGLPEHLA
jgi:myo-inositol-1(or 4)-monophosphatase